MAKNNENVLTEEFLAELYNGAITDDYLCSVVVQYMKDEYLPDREYQMLNSALKTYFLNYKSAPKYGLVRQITSSSRAVSELLDEIRELASGSSLDSIRDYFEQYLKLVRFKKAYREIGKKYDGGEGAEAVRMFEDEARKLSQFTLAPDAFVDVADTFESRLAANRERNEKNQDMKVVNHFYIDALDVMNGGRNLRTQLTVAVAMSGIGKSHLARWVGYNAAYIDGLDVLHIQLEGSASEVLDAYSACLVKTTTFEYETGRVSQRVLEHFQKQMEAFAGKLKVKAYSKFGKKISTVDLRNSFDEFKKLYGKFPDVAIVDSIDLLEDSSGHVWDNKSLRFKRIAVAEDLKDIAADTNSWIFGTYQATIENQDWVNDEKNVLNGYNLSEAKGLQRPCTHLITLNQSIREAREQTMRMHVAKSRFFSRENPTFRICTDYAHECFYDRVRTLNLQQQEEE